MKPEEETPDSSDDETRRKFREALERKKSSGGGHAGPLAGAKSGVKASNDKVQRQFRRKSG
jgi:hypothetical protein